MKKVFIKPGCITCGLCEFLAPKTFQVTDVAHVRPDADFSQEASQIAEAVVSCPVSVIAYEKTEQE